MTSVDEEVCSSVHIGDGVVGLRRLQWELGALLVRLHIPPRFGRSESLRAGGFSE